MRIHVNDPTGDESSEHESEQCAGCKSQYHTSLLWDGYVLDSNGVEVTMQQQQGHPAANGGLNLCHTCIDRAEDIVDGEVREIHFDNHSKLFRIELADE